MLPERFWVYREKYETVAKVKLVTKFKKPNQLYFGTMILASSCYCGDNAWLQRKQQHGASKVSQ